MFAQNKGLKITLISLAIIVIVTGAILFKFFVLDSGTNDHSLEVRDFGEVLSVTWNGVEYIECGQFQYESLGKTLATSPDKKYKILEVKDDKSHTFVMAYYGLRGHACMVKKDYTIPREGKVTAIYWDNKKITDNEFCKVVENCVNNPKETFEYELTDRGIFELLDNQFVKKFAFCYEDCPVGFDTVAWMGKINGRYVIANSISGEDYPVGERRVYLCKVIPDEYAGLMKKYAPHGMD